MLSKPHNKMQTIFSNIFVPETNWFKPELADEVPAFHSDRIFPNTTLGQCLPSFDVVDEVMAAVKTYLVLVKSKTSTTEIFYKKNCRHMCSKVKDLII